MNTDILTHTQLGKPTQYDNAYDFNLLQTLPREMLRTELQLDNSVPFSGVDIWNAYELSWLNMKGKPEVALAEIRYAADSLHFLESKALKLYLNSYSQLRFPNQEEMLKLLQEDLMRAVGGKVTIKLARKEAGLPKMAELPGVCLDDLDITVNEYNYDPKLLAATGNPVYEIVHSHLFRSNCPITNQPDWASVMIKYSGKEINHEGLLKYLVSFREHNEFHEQCVERIFMDILRHCAPEKLTVYARYTRRGGLDINPFRSNFESEPENIRTSRQ